MSMKSFDKFCEAMVNSDKDKNREVFDERRKQLQLHLAIQSMIIFIIMIFLHIFVSEFFYRRTDGDLIPMLLFILFGLIFYIIKAEVKGCFVGVSGAASRYVPGFICIAIGFMNGLGEFLKFSGSGFAIISNGMVTKQFIVLLCYALVTSAGILTVIFVKLSGKEKQK